MIDLDAMVYDDLKEWFLGAYQFGPDQPGAASGQLFAAYESGWMSEYVFPSPEGFEQALLALESAGVLRTRKLTSQELEDTNGPWTLMVENAKVNSK